MLKSIKSSFICKVIFSYIKNRRRLKIIKYNKSAQKKMDINIIYYKIFSGKYITYETETKGKEYNSYNNQLIFEGEYLNGEKNKVED